MRIYISGPMRGVFMHNHPAFDEAADKLRSMGHEVINPADMDRERGFRPESWTQEKLDAYDWSQLSGVLDHHQIVDEDLECLRNVDAIWMLNGWEKSKGANAEKAVAEWRQAQVFYDSESAYPVVESLDDPGTEIVQRLCELKDFAIANQRFGFAAWTRDLADRIKKELVAEKPNDHLADAAAYESMMVAAKKMKPSVGERRIGMSEALAAPYQGSKGGETKEDILEEALRITSGNRQASYGPPDQDFRRTAAIWSALFADMLRPGVTFEPFHIALAMIGLKSSRQMHQRKRDNWVDLAGYSRCGQICDESSKMKTPPASNPTEAAQAGSPE